MTDIRSSSLFMEWLQSSTKYDYYVTGLALALVAYWGKNLSPIPALLSRDSFFVAGLGSIVVAGYFGLRRIETVTTLMRRMHQRVRRDELASSLLAASTASPAIANLSTGEVFSAARAEELADGHRKAAAALDESMEQLAQKALLYYKWRNVLLGIGLLISVLSKIWPELK